MFITMGTSLFHSATWEPGLGALAALPEYRDWTEGDLLTSPEKRMSCGNSSKIREGLKLLLEARDTETWWECLPQDLRDGAPSSSTLMRYSAELSTLLKLADEEAKDSETLRDFLTSYEQIRLVYDPTSPTDGGKNLPLVAASHLLQYINGLTADKSRTASLKIPGLSSKEPSELLGDDTGLGKLSKEICGALESWDQVDIIISGGYKIYGIFLAPVLEEVNFARMIYVHEEGNILMRIPGEKPEIKPHAYAPKATLARLDRSRRRLFGRFN